MSNGLNLPEQAEGQVSFLLELESAGLSGLALGDDMHAPPLAPEFLERAEKLEFPVLAIPRDVPFVAVSKAVATANSDEEHKRLVQTVQLYEALRGAVSTGRSGATLLRELGRQLDCRLLAARRGHGAAGPGGGDGASGRAGRPPRRRATGSDAACFRRF